MPLVPAVELLLGLVDDVVFKLPLVFSCVVLVVLGLLLLPYVEPLELEGDVEDVPLPYVEPLELDGLVDVLLPNVVSVEPDVEDVPLDGEVEDVLLDGELYDPVPEVLELGLADDDWFQAEESVVALELVLAAVEEL